VENQVIPVKISVVQIVMAGIMALVMVLTVISGIYLLQRSDPYIQSVFELQGDPVRGQAIFNINCAGCHGLTADGMVGPGLHKVSRHKSSMSLIQQVTSGKTPPMPKFKPNPQEMADLLRYLERL
jgi:cytochrome c551/c552